MPDDTRLALRLAPPLWEAVQLLVLPPPGGYGLRSLGHILIVMREISLEPDGTIKVTREELRVLKILTPDDQLTLESSIADKSASPPLYWFRDTPEVRRILQFID